VLTEVSERGNSELSVPEWRIDAVLLEVAVDGRSRTGAPDGTSLALIDKRQTGNKDKDKEKNARLILSRQKLLPWKWWGMTTAVG
jgi:hypothetical protein